MPSRRPKTQLSPETSELPLASLRAHPQAWIVPAMRLQEYEALLTDIAAQGLRTPLVVDPSGTVLDGHQRLRAASELELDRLPVRVVKVADPLDYMLSAAICRRQLTASQLAAIVVDLEQFWLEQAEAKKRSRANLVQATEVATLPPRGERTREAAARRVGICPRTVQDAATVKAADPELFELIRQGELPAHRAAQQVRRERRYAEIGDPGLLPEGQFEVIYADPPWPSQSPQSDWAPEEHYPTMAFAEIEAFAVPAAEDAVLFLWVVPCQLEEGLAVLRAWGFEERTQIVWVKPSIGLGNWVRHRHELLLIGRRGKFPLPLEPPDSVVEAPRGRHSEKPELFYELIERMYPQATRLELFARRSRPGWTAWGNEVPT